MRRSLFVIFPMVMGLVGSTAACSSDDDSGATGTAGGATTCAADNRKDIYTQGLTKPAADFEVTITDSAFTPSTAPAQSGQVQKGMNSITVEVLDAAKQPVDGADVKLDLWMPDHAHGTARVPVITAEGGGKYKITEIWLPMAGLWRFTVTAKSSTADKSAEFNFCLDG